MVQGACRRLRPASLTVIQGDVAPTSVVSPNVSPNIFSMLGVQPLLGRIFTAQEGEANGPKVVLLSEGLWREAFHANPAIIGETIRVNNQARTVVGVMPAAFRFPESMGSDIRKGVWLPMQPTPLMLTSGDTTSTTSWDNCGPGSRWRRRRRSWTARHTT